MSEGSGFNPNKRRLCPDGACIGVIGDDGLCRVCGIRVAANGAVGATAGAFGGDEHGDGGGHGGHGDSDDGDGAPVAHEPHGDIHELAGGDDDESMRETMAAGGYAPAAGEGGFRPDRRLCDDGSCIGVVGGDRVCLVCGRTAG